MRALLSLLICALLCSASSASCPPQTPLATVNGQTVTLSYYTFVKSKIPASVFKNFYKNSDRELLDKIVERSLILAAAQKSGLFKTSPIREKVERFKIKRLSYMYLNSRLGRVSVSEKELQEALSRLPSKEKKSPQRIDSIKAALKTRKFLSEREKLLSSVKSRIKFLNTSPTSPSIPVAEFEGKEITFKELQPLISGRPSPEKLERATLDYALYLLALKEGLDRTTEFQNLLRWFKERLAVEEFKRELYRQVEVCDAQIKSYYQAHREEFKIPGRAEIEVWKFKELSEARRALNLLKKGETGKLPEPRRWLLSSQDADNPVARLVFSSDKELNLLQLPSGEFLLLKTLSRSPSRPMAYGDAYSQIKRKLISQNLQKLLDKKLSQLRKEFGVQIHYDNLRCLGKE